MKFCPTCQTRYDEEILRFCTKDGTPLIEEEQPAFTETELPSESVEDDFDEETIIRRNPPVETAPLIEQVEEISSPRIVIPTTEVERDVQPHVRARTETVYQVQPRRTNTGKIVLLTLLGTFLILGIFGTIFLMTRNSNDDNKNVNANFNSIDVNLNTNLPIGNSLVNLSGGINSNTNLNSNFNVIINANAKTPTPKPTVAPSATPPPIVNTNVNLSNSNVSAPTATATPKPSVSPPQPPTPKPTPIDTPPQSNRAVQTNSGL